MYVGLSDGNISICEFSDDKYPESMEPLKKFHGAAICSLCYLKGKLFSGSTDGSISVWESGNIIASRAKPKKGHKHNVMHFFPERDLVICASPERVFLFKNENFVEEEAATLMGLPAHMKAITGYYTTSGVRVFVGCEDGSLAIYDITKGQEGAVHPVQQLEKLHTKAIHCLTMFGPYLIATSHDKYVSMWNGKESASECNLIRKFQHKGAVTACFVEGIPGEELSFTWCFDESNKKIYKIVMNEHLPSLAKGHQSRLTFEVDPTAEISGSNSHIPDELSSALSPKGSDTSRGDEEPNTMRMKYKDFYSDTGNIQSLFDEASDWMHQHSDFRVLSVSTVPVIGARHTSEALFKHSLNQAAYDAALRTKPEHAVSVIQVVRVVYSESQ
eukprot:TRINITY_DN13614_c0_g1_i2.p1 TRINITY_DN13614_c0_g1~~TRINITY_DN13614_c0_g1_i2.p1  ORF type:complete len:387 (+),score=51.29 TRINITY_DN13614_c0_g1_i2:271-1431(+)